MVNEDFDGFDLFLFTDGSFIIVDAYNNIKSNVLDTDEIEFVLIRDDGKTLPETLKQLTKELVDCWERNKRWEILSELHGEPIPKFVDSRN